MNSVWVVHTSDGWLEGVFADADDAKTVAVALAGRDELPWQQHPAGWTAEDNGVTYHISARPIEHNTNLNDRTPPAKGSSDD